MRSYKGYSAKERYASLEKTKQAIARGELAEKPSSCDHCGQTEGLLEWHNDDYSHPTKYLVGCCHRCHILVYHSSHINAAAVKFYTEKVSEGYRWPPIFTRGSFGIFAKENGVSKFHTFDPSKIKLPPKER